jgi:integrase/recombinase XerD
MKEEISSVNGHIIPAMTQHLKLKAYSASTIKTYRNEMSQLLVLLKNISADRLTTGDIKRYLVFCYEKLQLKENTLYSRINALKFYYEQVLGREKFFWDIPRPRKPEISNIKPRRGKAGKFTQGIVQFPMTILINIGKFR